jgi:hypothetical protein
MKNLCLLFLVFVAAFLITTALAAQGGKEEAGPIEPNVTAVPGKVSTPAPKVEKKHQKDHSED